MEEAIVLYPSPAIGHLISMVELGKLILSHYPFLSINILITTPPYTAAGSTRPYINRVSATTSSIHFHHLPAVSLHHQTSSPHHETLTFQLIHLNNPHVHQAILSISQTSTVRALVMDSFCCPAMSVTAAMNIPSFVFFTSGAACLASFLYLPTIHRSTNQSFKDLGATRLHFPGLPPIPASDLAKPLQDRTDEAYTGFLEKSVSLSKAAGIIVNTFELLEPRAIKTIREGLCVPNEPTPRIYCIGPLIAADDQSRNNGGAAAGDECLEWLDSQPRGSVVFLCFGSLGLFSAEQLREIALGLERSGKRFLWVVRSPPAQGETRLFVKRPELDLDSLLPDGFLDRTKDTGLVVKTWAPQVAVLNHGSVGGFVTHCGWNSVLEAVCAGVPMVAWPLYAEQRFNRVLLVEELNLALPMEESKDGFVTAAEVEKRLTELMDSDSAEGNLVRNQILKMKENAKAAMQEGGTSRLALAELLDSWTRR